MKNSILPIAVGVLASALATGMTAWLVFGVDKVTRSEMTDYVQNQAPWVRDRGEIQAGIKGNTENIGKLESVVDKMVGAQQQLIVEQRVLVTKVDQFLERDH